jgi:hypothetical protein
MGESGMALAIFAGMLLILVAALLLAFLASRIAARSFGWTGNKRMLSSLFFCALGIGVGVVAVIATFYESTWHPPPKVTFNAPPGFTQNWVILLEDLTTSKTLVWQGVEMPFFAKRTVIDVPPSGIVRVRSLERLIGRVDTDANWNDGSYSTGQGGGPAPKATGAISFSAFNRGGSGASAQTDPPFGDHEAFGAYIAARENGAR